MDDLISRQAYADTEDIVSITKGDTMKRKMELIVKHPNGYSGMLFGESSLAVFDNRMHEIIHTGDRNIETAEDLYDMLEDIPGFVEMLGKINFDVDFEDNEDGI